MGESAVRVCDVGPRDGLQVSTALLSADVRAEMANRIAVAGVRCVEAVSFVSAARVPQMADAERVCEGLDRGIGASFAGLVLNRRGLRRARSAVVDEIHLAYPLTDTFSRHNQGCDAAEAAAAVADMVRECAADHTRVTVTLAVAFGCPFEGPVPAGVVASHAAAAADAGADEIVLADTVGFGFPRDIHKVVRHVRREAPATSLGIHLHNTRNTGYANAAAALEEGVRSFDASIGGLGGCPFAPRASGNVATEDLVHLLEGEGFETGVDLDALVRTTEWLEGVVPERLPGLIRVAGPCPVRTPRHVG